MSNEDASTMPPQPAAQSEAPGTVAFRAALAKARKDGFTITDADREHLRLRAIPLDLADRLAKMSDPTEIAAVLLKAINAAIDGSKG
jgi:hypothetical protein